MEEGTKREDESRALYEMIEGVNVSQVAVVYPDEQKRYLCSPDGIIFNGNALLVNPQDYSSPVDEKKVTYYGEPKDWGLELKNVLPKTQIERLLDGKLPSEYFHQCQGSMFITGFNRWDFVSYSPGLPPLILKVGRNEKFISALARELDKFCLELAQMIREIKDME